MNAINQSLIDELRKLHQTNPQVVDINLQFKEISNLLPYLHYLADFKNLKKLSLHGNRLKQLPTDLSMLKSLEELDLTNNLLTDVEMVLISLKTLPKLTNLKFQTKKKDKQTKICQTLKGLKFYNNTKVVREIAKKIPTYEIMNQQTLTQFSEVILKKLKMLIKLQSKYNEDQIDNQDQKKVKIQLNNIIMDSLEKLKGINHSFVLENLMFLTTKHQLFQIVKNRAVDLCTDIYGDLGKFIKTIFDDQNNLYKEVLDQSLRLAKIDLQRQQKMDERQKNVQIDPESRFFNKIVSLEKQVKRLRRQKQQYLTEINQLQTLNSKYIDAFVKFSKGDKIISFPKENNSFELPNARNHLINNLISTHPATKIDKNIKTYKQPAFAQNYSTNGRMMTLKQLKDTIEDMYDSKLKFDEKNFDGKLPRQTMNQYLFTYLNQKYGLKSLTIETANSIVSGIQNYSAEDNDVAVFGKILRNELDQEFRSVQKDLKNTINDLLKMHIKTKMPYKSTSEINEILAEKINNEIGYQQVEDLVKYLYDADDANLLMRKLEVYFKLYNKAQTINNKRITRQQQQAMQHQKSKRKVKFHTFVKCVLDFQMKKHQKLLKPLINTFKTYDRDNDGIVNEEQFISIIERLCEQADQIIPKLLSVVDPYQTKSINFTQMVKLVANYPVDNPILTRFLNEKQDNIDDDDQ